MSIEDQVTAKQMAAYGLTGSSVLIKDNHNLRTEIDRLRDENKFITSASLTAMNAQQAEIDRLRAVNARLVEALQALHDEDMDYIRINNLCGAENNQVLVNARKALAAAAKEGKP